MTRPAPAGETGLYGMLARETGAAAVSALLTLFFALSTATLAFQGRMAPFLDHGLIVCVLSTLAGWAVAGALSAQPGIGAQPLSILAIGYAGLAATALDALPADAEGTTVLATGSVLLAIASAASGVAKLLAARLGGDALLRHLPYPVLGGFMAAAGAGVLRAAWNITTPLETPGPALLALAVGGGMFAATQLRRAGPLMPPLLVLAACVALFGTLAASGLSWNEAAVLGWVRLVNIDAASWAAPGPALWRAAEFPEPMALAPRILGFALIALLGALLSAAGAEASTGQTLSLSRELAVSGLGTLAAAAVGGLPCSTAASVTRLRLALGSRGRLGVAASLVLLAAAAAWAMRGVCPLPIPIAAGMLVAIGVSFLWDWLIRPRVAWTNGERAIVVGIVAASLAFGFIEGIGFGVLAGMVLFTLAYARATPIRLSTTLATLRSSVERGEAAERVLDRVGNGVPVLLLGGFLFFASAHRLATRILAMADERSIGHVVVDFSAVSGMDAAAVVSLERLLLQMRRLHLVPVFTGLAGAAHARLSRAGTDVILAPALDAGLERVETEILEQARIPPPPPGRVAALLAEAIGPAAFRVVEAGTRRVLADGETLRHEGSAADGLYLVDAGALAELRGDGAGGSVRLRLVLPGGAVGETARMLAGRHGTALVAMGPTEVLHLPEAALSRLRIEAPADFAALVEHVCTRLSRRMHERDALAAELLR